MKLRPGDLCKLNVAFCGRVSINVLRSYRGAHSSDFYRSLIKDVAGQIQPNEVAEVIEVAVVEVKEFAHDAYEVRWARVLTSSGVMGWINQSFTLPVKLT